MQLVFREQVLLSHELWLKTIVSKNIHYKNDYYDIKIGTY